MVNLSKSADKYYAKCYCPGTDPVLASGQFKELRDKMYELRRIYTKGENMPLVRYLPGMFLRCIGYTHNILVKTNVMSQHF